MENVLHYKLEDVAVEEVGESGDRCPVAGCFLLEGRKWGFPGLGAQRVHSWEGGTSDVREEAVGEESKDV